MEITEQQFTETVELLNERIVEMELALEDAGWVRLAFDGEREFSRAGLREIAKLCRLMFLKNPLIQRSVNVQAHYVFGQGLTIQADDAAVNEAVQAFWSDADNRIELTRQQALTGKERELQVEGNLFFVLFAAADTGRVIVRTLPAGEIDQIVTDPEDAKRPWYYKRAWTRRQINPDSGQEEYHLQSAYYPDWRYRPATRPESLGDLPIRWDEPVYHARVGGLPDMRFGVPEVYAALDWAKAYKSFLEDWATITRALSRFAWNVTTTGGRAGLSAAKAKLASTLTSATEETNPPPVTGAAFVAAPGTKLDPIRTAGATTSAEDGRRLLLMVAAAAGLPESFYGDVSVGTLATARSLDRPTELKFRDRQTLWGDILTDLVEYAIWRAASAPSGALRGVVTVTDQLDGTPRLSVGKAPVRVSVTWPPILEHDVAATLTAITQAAQIQALDWQTLTRLVCQALGIEDVQAVLDAVEEERAERQERADEIAARMQPGNGDEAGEGGESEDGKKLPQATAEARMIEALRDLRRALRPILEGAPG